MWFVLIFLTLVDPSHSFTIPGAGPNFFNNPQDSDRFNSYLSSAHLDLTPTSGGFWNPNDLNQSPSTANQPTILKVLQGGGFRSLAQLGPGDIPSDLVPPNVVQALTRTNFADFNSQSPSLTSSSNNFAASSFPIPSLGGTVITGTSPANFPNTRFPNFRIPGNNPPSQGFIPGGGSQFNPIPQQTRPSIVIGSRRFLTGSNPGFSGIPPRPSVDPNSQQQQQQQQTSSSTTLDALNAQLAGINAQLLAGSDFDTSSISQLLNGPPPQQFQQGFLGTGAQPPIRGQGPSPRGKLTPFPDKFPNVPASFQTPGNDDPTLQIPDSPFGQMPQQSPFTPPTGIVYQPLGIANDPTAQATLLTTLNAQLAGINSQLLNSPDYTSLLSQFLPGLPGPPSSQIGRGQFQGTGLFGGSFPNPQTNNFGGPPTQNTNFQSPNFIRPTVGTFKPQRLGVRPFPQTQLPIPLDQSVSTGQQILGQFAAINPSPQGDNGEVGSPQDPGMNPPSQINSFIAPPPPPPPGLQPPSLNLAGGLDYNPCTAQALQINMIYHGYPKDPTKYIKCAPTGDPTLIQCDANKVWNPLIARCTSQEVLKTFLAKGITLNDI